MQNGPNWCKSSCHEVASEFFAMNAPDPPHWTLNSCFGVFIQFWCIWDRLVDLQNSMQKRAELVQKFVPRSRVGIFCIERTRSTPLDSNKCFGAFHKIWVHLGPFSWLMKLGAKRAELVQKFVPRSGVGIFLNERTHSTPLDPKLMF